MPPATKVILGEYVEEGMNHGRQYFRKQRVAGKKGPEVILFYWDDRDGKELTGWWFGDRLGGGQVWAHVASSMQTPPRVGWQCPVDCPVVKHIVCAPKDPTRNVVVPETVGTKDSTRARKRSADDSGATPPSAKRPMASTPPLVLASTSGEDASAAVKKLAGEYLQQDGTNHGKKTFLKRGSDAEPIWLYYWDSRDGPEFSGWWLGSKVGGALVYARSAQHSAQPAAKGWKIPHDGPVRNDVSLKSKDEEEEVDMTDGVRLQKARDLVQALESSSEKAVKTAGEILSKDDVLDEGIRAAHSMLELKVAEAESVKRSLVRHARAAKRQKASTETEAEISILEERLQVMSGSILKEFEQAEERLAVVDRLVAEERDGQTVDVELPLAMELTTQAEKATEAATTSEAAAKARDCLEAAKAKVSELLKAARHFAPNARKLALKEFGALQERCETTMKRQDLWASGKALGQTPTSGANELDELWAKELADVEAREDDDDDEEDAKIDLGVPDLATPEERMKAFGVKVAEVEVAAKQELDSAVVLLQKGSDATGMRVCQGKLKEKLRATTRLQKALTQEVGSLGNKFTSTAEALTVLGPRLQAIASRLREEIAKTRQEFTKLLRQVRQRERQLSDVIHILEGSALEGVDRAEDAVDLAIIEVSDLAWRRAQLAADEEEPRAIRESVETAQAAVDRAQVLITQAREQVDARVREARTGFSSTQQRAAFAEIAPMRHRLVNAQKRLNPNKTVKQDYQKQLRARQNVENLAKKMDALEADVQRLGETLAVPINSEAEIAGAERAMGLAQKSLLEVMRTLKSHQEKGRPLNDVVVSVKKRSQTVRQRLEEFRTQTREQRGGLGTRALLTEARRECETTEAWMKNVAEAEAPWEGHEVLPKEKAEPALEMATAIVKDGEPLVQAARTALMELLEQARGIPEELVRLRATEEVSSHLAHAEAAVLKVGQLKIHTFARKTQMAFPEAIQAVCEAEAKVAEAVKAGAKLEEDNLETISSAELKKIAGKIKGPAGAADKACAAARAVVEEKQKDPRFWESPSYRSQLSKLASRLEAGEKAISGMRTAATEANTNKTKTIEEQRKALAVVEQQISQVELLALPLGDERATEDSDASTVKAVKDAEDALTAWLRAAEKFQSNPHGAMRFAMARVAKEAEPIQARLSEVKESTLEQSQRNVCRTYIKEATAQLRQADAALERVDLAEGPFLKGIEVLDKDVAASAIVDCEQAASVAKNVLKKTREFFVAKVAEVAKFKQSKSIAEQVAELRQLQKRAAGLAQKLAQFCLDTEARKRNAILGA